MADSLQSVAAAIQPAVRALEQYAKEPTAAYTLSGLCIAAAPFGFGHKALNAGAGAVAVPRVLPPFWQLLGFAGFFATGGYMIAQGDALNGSGVVTAWSLTYVTFHTLPNLLRFGRAPLAALLSVGVTTLGLGVHGSYYFDKASWRGAVPGLLLPPRTA
ncbi:hypothetical protein MCUN1_003535 [Malassezia cuniculi]|uniref:Uncharacterized protein n=1 Tax=Malassezia cuniculi TaxID=948313 RepID=A0AAF0ETB6_9BASI|nr:hypothetical protein MCUN1_003535 [Malassezia cuniculi]